jgi:hypothetical protein
LITLIGKIDDSGGLIFLVELIVSDGVLEVGLGLVGISDRR